MGANFETMTLPGSMLANQVRPAFENAQAQDRHDNGHSYSGGLGMADGLTFPNKTFSSRREALDWLEENCQKWEAAQCVTFVDEKGETQWLIGALCSS